MITRSLLLLSTALLFACDGPPASAPIGSLSDGGTGGFGPADNGNSVIGASGVAQLFDWPFRDVTRELCSLRADGYSHVHVSPPELSNGGPWWGRYQPLDLRVIDGPLGNEADFKAMTAEAKRCGISIVADLVLNHAANLGLNESELFYPPGCDRSLPVSSSERACIWKPEHFNREECVRDWGNHCAVLYGRICGGNGDRGLPDLATGHCETGGRLDIQSRNYNPEVLRAAQRFIIKLADLGVTGIRLDAAKHMHPAFIEDLLSQEVRSRIDWAYGEIIADRAEEPSMRSYMHIRDLDFMDFALTRSMMEAFSFSGSLANLRNASANGRALPPDMSVAFVTQHDVWGNESGLGYRWGDANAHQDELLGHIFITGRAEGIPYIYSELADRSQSKTYRPNNGNYVLFHKRPEVRAMMRFHGRMLGTALRWAWEDQNHLAFARGDKGFVAINKSGSEWSLSNVNLLIADGQYEDLLSGNTINVRNGRTQSSVPARWGLMLIKR